MGTSAATPFEGRQQDACDTTTDLSREAVGEIVSALRQLLADVFALYLKTKNSHWHMSGRHFRDYHLLLDQQAGQIFAMTDDIAERVRKIGGGTIRSISDITRHQRLKDNNEESVSPENMLAELLTDNQQLTRFLRSTHGICDQYNDVATASLVENWIDETERRTWFVAEIVRDRQETIHPSGAIGVNRPNQQTYEGQDHDRQEAAHPRTKTQAFIDALAAQGGKPIYEVSYADARQVLEDAQAGAIATLPADVEDQVVPVGPTGEVSIRIYRPTGAKGLLPVVMYFHGGGWVLGSKYTHDRLLRDLVNGANAAFVFVNYTPSPEAQFPVPIEQVYAATKYVSEHGEDLGLDASRLAVAGESVGGYMTAVVAQLAKERKGPSIRYQVMMYPVTDSSMSQPTYKEFANGPWLTAAAMDWFWDAYAPHKEDRTKTTASPLSATLEQLEGLPPALVIMDENDILRDEGELYAKKLIQAGVDVTPIRVLATHHHYALLNALADTPATKATVQIVSEKLSEALGSKSQEAASA